jgi:CHAT domain-containing protein/tetratricopeptide (TPR) repeat protein
MIARAVFQKLLLFCLCAELTFAFQDGHDANESITILGRAEQLSNLFNWADAGPLYARAEKLFASSGDRRNALYAKFGRIRGSMETLNLPDMSDYLGKELQSPLLINDLRLRLMCLIVKGDIDGEIESGPATADWKEALAITEELDDKRWESRANAELGFEQFIRGESTAAMKAVGGALVFAHKTGDAGAEIRYLGAIGTALAERRSDDEAISYLDRALALAKKNPDSGYPFVPVAGKVQALINKKAYHDALSLIAESKQEAKTKHKDIKLAQLLLFEADIALSSGEPLRAERILKETASLTQQNQSRLFGDCEMKLADIYLLRHDIRKAELAAKAALEATGENGDLDLAPTRLRTLASLEVALGNKEKADALLQRATDIIEGFVTNAPDVSVRSAILTQMSPIFEDHFALAAERGRKAEGFHIIEQIRGRIVAESILRPKRIETADTQTEDRVRRLKVNLVKASTPLQRHTIVDQLFFAEQARWTDLSPDTPLPSINPASEATLSAVQHRLKFNEVILEYVLGERQSFCLEISRLDAKIIKLARREEIESIASTYVERIKAMKDASTDAQALAAAVVSPLNLPRNFSSIIIVPDGMLNLVPFQALPDSTGNLFVRGRTIWYLSSASAIVLQRRGQQVEAPKIFFGVGGVDYGAWQSNALMADASTSLRRGSDYGLDLTKMPNLPGTDEEVRNAAQVWGGDDSVLKLGVAGTETAFKSAPLREFRIIHLAIHGRANSKSPERAALVFRPNPPDDDGLLEPREILGLRLNADLVVLSACETAVGHLQGQEGIANLSRMFLTIGAKSVVSTLWQIDDTYSLFVMKRFYAHLRSGKPVAESLAMSQNDLLDKFGAETPPAYWAAFTVIGEGSTVVPATRTVEVNHQ